MLLLLMLRLPVRLLLHHHRPCVLNPCLHKLLLLLLLLLLCLYSGHPCSAGR
jgi:hypothetical protein